MYSSRSHLILFTLILLITIPITLRYFDNILNIKHNKGIELITVNILLALIINAICRGKEFLVGCYNVMLILIFINLITFLFILPDILYLNTHPWVLFNPKSPEFQSHGLAIVLMSAFPALLYLTYLLHETLIEFGVKFEDDLFFVQREEENGQEMYQMV